MPTGIACAALLLAATLAGCTRPGWREQLQSEDPIRRIDGAIAAGQARDPKAAALLVDRLEDDDEAVRMYAILALQRIEGTDLDYKYWASDADRARMAQQWRTYLKNKHQADPQRTMADVEGAPQASQQRATAASSQPHTTGGMR